MAEDATVENGRISNFEGLVTLTLDQVILHTIVHHSSTLTYVPNFIETEETFCGWTDVHTYACTYLRKNALTFETGIIWSTLKSRPKNRRSTALAAWT